MRKQGISLVALVITIIVLIILTGAVIVTFMEGGIIERAKEAKVPIHQDSKLADTLARLEIGEMIPPELYEVVAEILVFVDAMDKIKRKM